VATTASDLPRTWMTPRFSRWLGIACLALTLTLEAVFIALIIQDGNVYEEGSPVDVVVGLTTFVLLASVGALILARLPGHPVGVLFALSAVGMMWTNTVAGYVLATNLDLPARAALAALADPLWPVSAAALAIYLPLLFPTGTYLEPRWRWVGRIAGICLALLFVSWAFRPGPLVDTEGYDNPLGIPGIYDFCLVLELLGFIGMLGGILLGVVALVLRFRRSQGVEREQLKWFVAAILAVVALFVVITPVVEAFDIHFPDAVYLLFMGLVPASVGFAILRYRLYDIDYIINRTIVYATLTALLAGLYAAAVQLSKLLFDDLTGGSDAALVLTTLILAAAFTPAKNTLQKVVDRYYGHVHTPSKDLEAYSDRLRSVVLLDVGESTRQFLTQSAHSLGAASGRIDLGQDGSLRTVALLGDPFASVAAEIPLRHAGEQVGVLSLGPLPSGAGYTAEDIEVLQATADLLAHAITVAGALPAPAAKAGVR
jgi:hypothetical protein